jgi:hypothetical protein
MAKKKNVEGKRMIKLGSICLSNMKLNIALDKIYKATFDSYDIIDQIVTLQEELEPIVEGFNKRHEKIIKATLPKDDNGAYKYEVGGKEHMKFTKEKGKLSDELVEIKCKKILVSKNEVKEAGLKLNADDIMALRKAGLFEIRKSK